MPDAKCKLDAMSVHMSYSWYIVHMYLRLQRSVHRETRVYLVW